MFDKNCPKCKKENSNIEVDRPIEICADCGYEHHHTPQAAPEAGSDELALLNDLLTDKERYETICKADNPDHWSRGWNNGYLEAINKMIRKIKAGI
jgi:NMD protein affecting ribosome stability and mRNA decay